MVKRILFVSPTGTLDNGAEKSITSLMIYLSQNGYQIYNVYPENSHYTHNNYVRELSDANIILYPLQTLKWWWEEAPGGQPFSKEERILFYQKNIAEIRDIIRTEGIQLVISNTVNVFQGSIAAACECVPHFWLIHEFPNREFAYYAKKINYIFENSDRVFSVEGALSQKLFDLSNQNPKLNSFVPYSQLPNNLLLNSDERRIVSLGMINENKNQIELLQAYIKLNRLDLPLVFIGDWEEKARQKCDELIKKYSLTNVHFLGYKDDPWNEITNSDICVFTSKSESFSLVFVESILKGVPSIVSNIDGYNSARQFFKAGISYTLGDTEELAERISYLLQNFDEIKKNSVLLSAKAKNLYSIENCFSSIISAIKLIQLEGTKSLCALETLLGNTIPNHEIFDMKTQFVSIFYAEEEDFSEENSYKFPFQYSDKIFFEVPETTNRLRIDLSEVPTYFNEVTLKMAHDNNSTIPISFTNGITIDNGILFGKNDPQIVYDISGINSRRFTFTYELKDIFKVMKEGSLLTELAELQLQNKNLLMENQQLTDNYSVVVNSKRWKITSKIINFFRRNK